MRRDRGFTIVEIVVVMGIIGVLAAVALPSIFGETLPHMRLKSTARDIYTAFQTARSKAVNSTSKYGVQFDLDASPKTYRLVKWNGSSWAAEAGYAAKQPEARIQIDNISGISSGAFLVEFSPVGTASSTAGANVNAEVKLNRADSAGDKYKVVVSTATGYVSIATGW